MFDLDIAVSGDSTSGLSSLIYHTEFPAVGLNEKKNMSKSPLKHCDVLNFGN